MPVSTTDRPVIVQRQRILEDMAMRGLRSGLRSALELADIFGAEGPSYRASQAGHLSLTQVRGGPRR